jgi:hypothetical protein
VTETKEEGEAVVAVEQKSSDSTEVEKEDKEPKSENGEETITVVQSAHTSADEATPPSGETAAVTAPTEVAGSDEPVTTEASANTAEGQKRKKKQNFTTQRPGSHAPSRRNSTTPTPQVGLVVHIIWRGSLFL